MTNRPVVTLESFVARSDEVLTSEVDGEVVMMSIEQGTYSGLNGVGSEIWRLLETRRQVSEICAQMTARYEVEGDLCEEEVLAFLNELASDGTIRIVDPSR